MRNVMKTRKDESNKNTPSAAAAKNKTKAISLIYQLFPEWLTLWLIEMGIIMYVYIGVAQFVGSEKKIDSILVVFDF